MPNAPSSAETHPRGRTPPRILLVEDEVTIAVTLGDDLRDDGCEVTLVGNGEDALQRLSREPFDAIISDLRLPGVDGLEVLRAARRRQPGARLLLVTAYADERHERALRATDACLLQKPFANESVLAWLHDRAAG